MVMLGLVMISHVARGCATAAASATEALVAGAHGFGAVSPHGMCARGGISILGHGLSYLIAIGCRLGPRVACGRQQCNSNRDDDPRHVDCFLSNVD
jgi:hypothetical protein